MCCYANEQKRHGKETRLLFKSIKELDGSILKGKTIFWEKRGKFLVMLDGIAPGIKDQKS